MSTWCFYTDLHRYESHTHTHTHTQWVCQRLQVRMRRVIALVSSHHLGSRCLWQSHQPRNEDTETTRGWTLRSCWGSGARTVHSSNHLRSCNYINSHITSVKILVRWLNCNFIDPKEAWGLNTKQSIGSQTGFTSRLMMIAFINNGSVFGQAKCNINNLRHLEGSTSSLSMA